MVFCDLTGEAAGIKFPTHVAPEIVAGLNEENIDLLKRHFIRSMEVHFVGGDIFSDMEIGEFDQMVFDLGLDPKSEDDVNLFDEKWKTPIGKELFRVCMEDNLHYSNESH